MVSFQVMTTWSRGTEEKYSSKVGNQIPKIDDGKTRWHPLHGTSQYSRPLFTNKRHVLWNRLIISRNERDTDGEDEGRRM
jgi:hypothetical protein